LELNVRFAGEELVSGTTGDLVDEDDEEYAGEIIMTGGTTELDPTFALELCGAIEPPNGMEYEVDETSIALGYFYGDDYVFGGIADDLCTAEDCVEFGGSFNLER
jgi:hypothetical protein